MSKILIALGGNALEHTSKPTIEEQKLAASVAAAGIVELVAQGNEVIVTHGNGPQVGRILLQNEIAKEEVMPQPLDVCGSMTQGFIGYILQNAIQTELRRSGLQKQVLTVVTQVVVDAADKAFGNPTKPIGSFVSEQEAAAIMSEKDQIFKEDSGRGWRRVVASPTPKSAVELESIKLLSNAGVVAIVSGGGGIPVIEKEGRYEGIEAVIDKDLSAAMLAAQLDFDYLLILTAVDKVALNFGKPDQVLLDNITAAQAEEYSQQGHFAEGSMLPKVKACIDFIKTAKNQSAKAVITSLENAKEALDGTKGTTITK